MAWHPLGVSLTVWFKSWNLKVRAVFAIAHTTQVHTRTLHFPSLFLSQDAYQEDYH